MDHSNALKALNDLIVGRKLAVIDVQLSRTGDGAFPIGVVWSYPGDRSSDSILVKPARKWLVACSTRGVAARRPEPVRCVP